MSIDEKLKGWIFQGNPLRFDVDTYLRNWNPILWTIGPAGFAKKMSIGDYAFIWRSDGMVPKSGGIVALGIMRRASEFRSKVSLDRTMPPPTCLRRCLPFSGVILP